MIVEHVTAKLPYFRCYIIGKGWHVVMERQGGEYNESNCYRKRKIHRCR